MPLRHAREVAGPPRTDTISVAGSGEDFNYCEGESASGSEGGLATVQLTGSGRLIAKAKPGFKFTISGCTYGLSRFELSFVPPVALTEPGLRGTVATRTVPPSSASCGKTATLGLTFALWGEQESPYYERLEAEAP